jgi:predicted small lipoprotein YifL
MGSARATAFRVAVMVAAIVSLAGCGSDPGPSVAPPGGPNASTGAPDGTDPSTVVVDQLGGPWRYSPVILDDAHIAIVSDACAAKARETLGDTAANLPTALVDARGELFVTVIMADDLDAIECLALLDDAGTSATVEAVDLLSETAVAPVDKAAITIASVVAEDDRSGGRTVSFGRIGPDAAAAKVSFGDASTVLASSANGWWAMWWPGAQRATGFSAVDTHDLVIGSATAPAGQVESRVGPADWWIDPKGPAPTATSTTIHALIRERACASGNSPDGRVDPPVIDLEAAAGTNTFEVRRLPGDQDCQGNAPFVVTIKLGEALGARTLLDGSSTPPRDATKPPTG